MSITVHLAPGFDPEGIVSPYHRITVSQSANGQRTVTLAQGEEPADRDFELRWHPASSQPALGLFRQQFEGESYVMATITPQARIETRTAPAREMVFVIDNSGSMGGESMAAAKQSLVHALGTLRPQDSFNVIRFDDTMTMLFEHAIPATPDQVALARTFAEGLEAAGGTEMLPALKAALIDASPEAKTVRQIVFLTDGIAFQRAGNDGRDRRQWRAQPGVHGRHRIGPEQLPDAPHGRGRARNLHQHRRRRGGHAQDDRNARTDCSHLRCRTSP